MNENIFFNIENMDDDLPFFKRQKFWFRVIIIVFALILLFVFYQFVIKQTLDPKELKAAIRIDWYDTKWMDKEISPYEIKIVPAIAIKIKNVGAKLLHRLELQGIFKFADSDEAHSDGYTYALDKPLPPGKTSDEILIKAFWGYSASSKEAFLKNPQDWKRMFVQLSASSQGSGWVSIGPKYEVKQIIEGIDEETQKAILTKTQKNLSQLGQFLQVVWQDSKWLESAKAQQEIYIIPSIRIKVKNTGDRAFRNVLFKGEFEFADSGKKLGEGVTEALSKPLVKDQTSEEILIKSDLGYSASSKKAFFDNISQWQIVKVKIFIKSADIDYVLLGIYPIKKEIEGVKVIYQ